MSELAHDPAAAPRSGLVASGSSRGSAVLPLPGSPGDAAQPLVEDEMLVEEISIDGMCGVY